MFSFNNFSSNLFYFFALVIGLLGVPIQSSSSPALPRVTIVGTIHRNHLQKKFGYSLSKFSAVVASAKPQLICGEVYDRDASSKMVGYYPPENAIAQEVATKIGATFFPSDWRGEQDAMESAEVAMTPAERKEFDSAHSELFQAIPSAPDKIFDFIHSQKARRLIKKAHEIRISAGTEIADGYWYARNQMIVKKCMRYAIERKFANIVFTFGVEHEYIIREYLLRDYSANAKTLKNVTVSAEPVSETILAKWTQQKSDLEFLLNDPTTSNSSKNMIASSKRIEELADFIATKGLPEL